MTQQVQSPAHRQKAGQAKARILIVDDEDRNLRLLSALCRQLGHDPNIAHDGREGVFEAKRLLPDLILMDGLMPEMDGFEATELLKNDESTRHIPVIIVTALDSRADRLLGIAKGANDFLTKPVDAEELELRLRNNLKIKEHHDLLQNYATELEARVAERTQELREAFERLDRAHCQIKAGYLESIDRLSRASEYKDQDTGIHIRRVCFYARHIAEHLGTDPVFQETIFYAAAMHDIGKVGIPDGILLKPAPHTPEEWEIMKTHATIGGAILHGSESPFLQMAEQIALTHHERWDGGGYPRGLRGEEIPLAGRIMNVVDQYDALRSKRPYKPALDHERALQILFEGDGRTAPQHFDPRVLGAIRECSEELRAIYEGQRDLALGR